MGCGRQVGYKGNADLNLLDPMMLIKSLVIEMDLPAIEPDIRYKGTSTTVL